MDSGDVTKMGKDDQNVKDAGDEEEKKKCDEGSKEGTGGSKRSKRDRRSRRKTNSECSPTPRPSITSDPGLSDDGQGTATAEEPARTASVAVGENEQNSSVEDGSGNLEGKSSPRTHYKREDSILSVGGKPKVVVPSPKGKTNMITGSVHLPRYSQAHTESQEPRECSIKAEQGQCGIQ